MITIERQVGERYRYIDDELGIEMKLKQLHIKHFDGSGHLEIWGDDPRGIPHRIYSGRTPITTTAAKKRIALDVEQTLRGDEKKNDNGMQGIFGVNTPIILNDWKHSVAEALDAMLDRHYRGDPPVNLFEDNDGDDEMWRMAPILSEDINLIYGNPGTGKSYLAIILGQAINQGLSVCNLTTTQGKVLLIDYETTKAKMRRRFYRVNEGLGIESEALPIEYMKATVPIAQRVESLQEYIMSHDIDFLIIDSLARASGGSISDDEGIGLFFEAIRQLERPCLIIHHTNRADDFFGSGYIKANARNMWKLTSAAGEDGVMSLSLTQEKENDGPNMGSLSLSLTFQGNPYDPEAVILATQDPALAPFALQKLYTLPQRLVIKLNEMPDKRMTRADLIDDLSLDASKRNTLRQYFWALKEKNGKYKKLARDMHVRDIDGVEYLCLNTENNYAISSNGTGPIKPKELEPTGGSTADYLKSRGARSPEVASEPDELFLGFNDTTVTERISIAGDVFL